MLFPAFLKLEGRPVLVVGGGTVAEVKTRSLLAAKACVTVVAPQIDFGGFDEKLELRRRPFVPEDVDTCWLAVAAATPDVNRQVARAASARSRFVIAVDDTASSSAYAGAVLRRGGVTLSISTDGRAPLCCARPSKACCLRTWRTGSNMPRRCDRAGGRRVFRTANGDLSC